MNPLVLGYVREFVSLLFQIMTLAILARVLLSWFPMAQGNRLAAIVYDITEPVLGPIRKLVPPMGMLDLSPFIAMIVLQVVGSIILSGLRPY